CTLEKETLEQFLSGMLRDRGQLSQQKKEWAEQVQARRQHFQARHDQVHERDVEVRDLRHRLDTIVGRLREDYQIDLEAVYRESQSHQPDAPARDFDPAAANTEI